MLKSSKEKIVPLKPLNIPESTKIQNSKDPPTGRISFCERKALMQGEGPSESQQTLGNHISDATIELEGPLSFQQRALLMSSISETEVKKKKVTLLL